LLAEHLAHPQRKGLKTNHHGTVANLSLAAGRLSWKLSNGDRLDAI
jgi:hypothetical protein